ncbi:uncharacterized protein C12orf71 homolog isoform X2 [Rattus norvegicus]|uniref:uncharacterized protein C12orf71 homolog isoform X2 n=1 Tax=Rattus norvegicus TaxID=10116 RepID=UPI0003D0B8A6|nr:uncharacterized protein C12orf71 homolog isoform X2 [Rattus norvegicus]|eukprot:XP_008761651.1 PREDICTED: uncharacterized protein C12orf71 homolog isoform X3 [Rattus norvegicus]
MTTSASSSDYSNTEDCISECKSNQSASVGYYPSENTFSYEDVVSPEEAASVESSAHFLPPVQGSWGTESLRRLFRKRDQMKHDPEQFCKLSITLAWDIDVGSDRADSLANLDLNSHSQWMNKWPEDRTKLTPYKLDNLVRKLETFLGKEKGGQHDSHVLPESTQKEDVFLNSSPPPHTAQEISQADGSSLETSSMSSPRPEDASHLHRTSCMNFQWVFHWLRTQVSSRWRREHPSQAPVSWHQKAMRRMHSFRGNRIQPQE